MTSNASAIGKRKRPVRRRTRRLFSTESLIWLGLFGVAGGAAFLPWYAVSGGHNFGIRNDGMLRLSGHRDDLARSGFYSSLRPFGRNRDPFSGKDGNDTLETGTIPEISRQMKEKREKARSDRQPFPARPYHLVHVANGQALISDGDGIYLVGVGSKLPDNSRLESFRRQDGGWVIVTSNGEVIGD